MLKLLHLLLNKQPLLQPVHILPIRLPILHILADGQLDQVELGARGQVAEQVVAALPFRSQRYFLHEEHLAADLRREGLLLEVLLADWVQVDVPALAVPVNWPAFLFLL